MPQIQQSMLLEFAWPKKGYLCMLNQALYPIDTPKVFIYALFISNHAWINKHFLVDSMICMLIHSQFSLLPEKYKLGYLTETHIEQITPPPAIIYVGSGFEG